MRQLIVFMGNTTSYAVLWPILIAFHRNAAITNTLITNTLCAQLRQQLGDQFNDQIHARDRRIADLERELAEIASVGMQYHMADSLPFVQDLQGAVCDIQSKAHANIPEVGSMVDKDKEAWIRDVLEELEHVARRTMHMLEDHNLARLSAHAGNYYCPGGAYSLALNQPLYRDGATYCRTTMVQFLNKYCQLEESDVESWDRQDEEEDENDERDAE
ncbi:hypothetical protein VNI00_017698 [Paramarasmius palmivorus]|uniref:Uncharacterized protein n=1 Tax=Paramarasmius palmivorus TaxID=297713 RepID=A0AAW0B3S0_9AGAR